MIGWAFVSREWGDWFTVNVYRGGGVYCYSGIDSLRRPIK